MNFALLINTKLIKIHINLYSMNFDLMNLDLPESNVIIDKFISIHVYNNFNECLNSRISN